MNKPQILKISSVFALIALSYFGAIFFQNRSSELSPRSLSGLRQLNFEYEMVLSDVYEENSLFIGELAKANALFMPKEATEDYPGLLLNMPGRVLELTPTQQITPIELQKIGSYYEANIPELEHVELDQSLEIEGEPVYEFYIDPNVELSSDEDVFSQGIESIAGESRDSKVVVAVMDSGVDVTHPIFDNHTMLPGYNARGRGAPGDEVGHGTHVAGILAQNNAEVAISPYKVYDRSGKLSDVLRALHYATHEDDIDVINMSLGIPSPSYSLEKKLEEARDEGILLVSAAGNDGKSSGFYPASYNSTIAVAGVDPTGRRLSSSNFGTWVDVASLGYRVQSALPGGQYGVKSGTSQAAPVVSAQIAKYLSELENGTQLSRESVLMRLRQDGTLMAGGRLSGAVLLGDFDL